jgi:hypothetical protein
MSESTTPGAKTEFDPERYLIVVQGGKKYLPVAARIIWFRHENPDWGIVTTPIEINLTPEGNRRPYAIFQAQIFNAEGRLMATGTKMEDAQGFPDFLEKAETSSVGRALALCGFGTQFCESEMDEGRRVADSPQRQQGVYTQQSRSNAPPPRQVSQGGYGNAPAGQR